MRQLDQHLKERLVGAAVLVIVGVLVIPVLLDGPPPDEPVRVGLELPTAAGERKSHTIRLDIPAERPATPGSGSIERPPQPASDPDRAETSKAKSDPSPERPASSAGASGNKTTAGSQSSESGTAAPEAGSRKADPPAASREAAAEPAPAPAAAPPESDPAPGGWAVQLGSFSDQDNAERLSGQLRSEGYSVFVSRVATGGRTMHRVRVGPVADKDEAQALADRLDAGGHAGRVVAIED